MTYGPGGSCAVPVGFRTRMGFNLILVNDISLYDVMGEAGNI